MGNQDSSKIHSTNSEQDHFSILERYDAICIPKENLKILVSQNSSPQSFIELKKLVDEGSVDAQLEVGLLYDKGFQVKQSDSLAFYYFQLAANQGDSRAQAYLARLYKYGGGVEQSYQKAFNYYQLAADQENLFAIAELGKMYEEGLGVEKSYPMAIRYYTLAADLGGHTALCYLAEAYEQGIIVGKSQEKANFYHQKKFSLCKEKADEGDIQYQYLVGSYYENGQGTGKSLELAFHYYKLSADQNHKESLIKLATCFAEGLGVRKSEEKAIHYYKLAADQGYIPAQFLFTQYLLDNKINEEQAVHYLKLIIQGREASSFLISTQVDKIHLDNSSMLASCEYDLGKCFEEGIGIKQSSQNAFYYYNLAANHGDALAQNRLGDAYKNGELGLSKSVEKAIYYYKIAAENGFSIGYAEVAYCYKELGGYENEDKADMYFRMANATKDKLEEASNMKKQDVKIEPGKVNKVLPSLSNLFSAHVKNSTKIKLESDSEIHKDQFLFIRDKEKADKGNCLAQYDTGIRYKTGKGIEQSLDLAIKYFKLAADQGWLASCKEVIYYYNTYKQYGEANKYVKIAADLGDAEAQYNLGLAYLEGASGIEKSNELSSKYLNLAAQQEFYSVKLFQSYQASAKKEDGKAIWKIGILYSSCKLIKENVSKAIEYYKLAATKGYSHALYELGCWYENGIYLEKSIQKAIEHYTLAADSGNRNAQFMLGEMYRKGHAVEQSLTKAIEYYQMAAENGHAFAKCKIDFWERSFKLKENAVFYPNCKALNIPTRNANEINIETLKNVLYNNRFESAYLILSNLSDPIADLIRDAMIQNIRLTFVSFNHEDRLIQSFERLGYDPHTNLRKKQFDKNNKTYHAYVFIKDASKTT